MHELFFAQAMVSQLVAAAEREGAKRVVRVVVSLGALCGVHRDPLEFAWPVATEQTLLAGAQLVVEEVAAVARCAGCQQTSQFSDSVMICPKCGSTALQVFDGRDCIIESMDVV